ncbi:MAG TPA: hypothetical protein VHN98_12670 [Acidimicrobiales bacterium]|nr:hypothetical protein [Acidimicrobiales bacterium]
MPKQPEQESLGGLVGKWFKTQVGGWNRTPSENRREEERTENEIRSRVRDEVEEALTPQFIKDANARHEAERERRRLDEYASKPQREVMISFGGSVTGSLTATMAVEVDVDRDDDTLRVSVTAPDGCRVGNAGFSALEFTVYRYAGAGTYDFAAMLDDPEVADSWDGTQCFLMTDPDGEGFYWDASYGPATVVVGAGERTARARLTMQDAGSATLLVDAIIPIA